MLKDIVNEFRKSNGKPEGIWNDEVSGYCNQHCLAMEKAGNIYHAEQCYRGDWGEAVAVCGYNGQSAWEWVSCAVYNILGGDNEHKDLILNSNDIAGAYQFSDYKLYITIRGK